MVSMSTAEFEEIMGIMNENEIEVWATENVESADNASDDETEGNENQISIASARIERYEDMESDSEDHKVTDLLNMVEAHERSQAQRSTYKNKKLVDHGTLMEGYFRSSERSRKNDT